MRRKSAGTFTEYTATTNGKKCDTVIIEGVEKYGLVDKTYEDLWSEQLTEKCSENKAKTSDKKYDVVSEDMFKDTD